MKRGNSYDIPYLQFAERWPELAHKHPDSPQNKEVKKAAKAKAPGRKMTKTEAAFSRACQWLQEQGRITGYDYEAITFRLAHDCRYTADWTLWLPSGHIIFVEVKRKNGWIHEDGIIKIRVAADRFPVPFFLVTYDRPTWEIKAVPGAHRLSVGVELFEGI